MDKRSTIEIALRAAKIASTILQLLGTNRKCLAKLIVAEAANQLMELDKFVERLPED